MSKNNPNWNGYIVLGNIVNIYNSNNVIEDKRELFPNIDDVLVLENRISLLTDYKKEKMIETFDAVGAANNFNPFFAPAVSTAGIMINLGLSALDFDYHMLVTMGFLIGSYSIDFALDKHKSNVITNNYLGVSELYISEIKKTKLAREVLLSDTIDENKVVRNQVIKLREDRNYGYVLAGRESIFENYNKIRKKIKREKNKEKLDEYMDSIGCTEEDKKLLLEIYDKESIKPRTMHKQLVRK